MFVEHYMIEPFSSSSAHTKYLPPVYPTEMADQYGLTPEDYVNELKDEASAYYSQGILLVILSFSKQRLKPIQVIVIALMLYDFIYHVPQQVRLSVRK